MLGMNEAMFMTESELDEVREIILQFEQIVGLENLFIKTEAVEYQGRQTGVKVLVSSDKYADGAVIYERQFVKSPCTESWGTYLDRVRSYLFTIAADFCENCA